MSLPDRRTILLGLGVAVATSACGFAPVHAPGSAANQLAGAMRVAIIPGRDGFALREALVRRWGTVAAAEPWEVKIALVVDESSVGISAANAVTRIQLRGQADYQVVLRGVVVAEGTAINLTAYDRTGTIVANRAAERAARDALAVSLADQIADRLEVTAGDWTQ